MGGGLLIKSSFDSWSESPVKTTVETLPIANIRLPRVTVCPPKNTFTDLNYDLMMTENKILTKEMRDEMFKYAVEVINKDSVSNPWAKLQEEDRFYNWYHGYTQLKLPYDYVDHNNDKILTVYTFTSATSGVVSTQYYGEEFQSELVERIIKYGVFVNPPESVKYNKNVTLQFKVEEVRMNGLTTDKEGRMKEEFDYSLTGNFLVADQTTYVNYTPPKYFSRYIRVSRSVSAEDVEEQKLSLMPGFRLTWWYAGEEVSLVRKYKDDKWNKQFVRYAK